MENSYGVGVVNRYALFLDDESDPLDAIKARQEAKELKKKTKEAEKENKGKPEAKPKTGSAVPRKGIKETQNVKSQEIKTGEQQKNKGPPRTNDRNSERPPQRRREDRPQNGAVVEGKDGARPPRREFGDRKPNYERRNFNDNPEGGERRGPRPPREPREGQRGPRQGYDGRGKREFDRRSGSDKTGVKPVDKREGGGPHNWGTVKDELDEINKTGSEGEVAEDKATDAAAAGAGDGQQADGERAAPAEEEPRELTLDEYKALRNAQRMAPQYNLRKAGEGEDLSQWKNLVKLEKKKEAEGGEDESDDEYDIADYPQRVGRQKRVLGIEFTFNDTARRGGTGGRGRGRGRGRGGRGPPPGREEPPPQEERPAPRSQVAPPKVDDSKDFPSLS
ncbi:plasminogen activator inhibitor 1 RNA-binding protein-like [Aricia agestis]|uniref:plasminogen activator inhibitor 1 RNA-binding protein-like n=1 Tax=Aricia agestis TaxID=91739 RepID=UPI001C208821|nr:plasminogen activator inhibitor 1 RNA-binding protein-like [Aricia agestis]